MLIHLIRHTTPDVEKGICYGQTDLNLANSFSSEKLAIHTKLLSSYDVVYTSPLRRCTQLADTLSTSQRFVDKRLLEYNFGDWEMKPWTSLNTPEAKTWMDNYVHQTAPNGDSIVSMKKRVDDFFNQLYLSHYKTVAVVAHSGVQRLIHAEILQTPLEHMFRLQLDFGSVLEIKYSQKNAFHTIKHL